MSHYEIVQFNVKDSNSQYLLFYDMDAQQYIFIAGMGTPGLLTLPAIQTILIDKTNFYFELDQEIFKFMLADPLNSGFMIRAVGSSGFYIRDGFSS